MKKINSKTNITNNANILEILKFLLEQCAADTRAHYRRSKSRIKNPEEHEQNRGNSKKKNIKTVNTKTDADNDIEAKIDSYFNEKVIAELKRRGFSQENIQTAFLWFMNLLLQYQLDTKCSAENTIRIFNSEETEKIGKDGQGFIFSVERIGIINSKTREIVITQLMQLPQKKCTLDEIRWVILMVLLCQQFNSTSKSDNDNVAKQIEKYSLYLM